MIEIYAKLSGYSALNNVQLVFGQRKLALGKKETELMKVLTLFFVSSPAAANGR
jgi:hypothetical protein